MRKQLGGGMRQVGILAAAGIVALETMIPRLAEDHANARLLSDALGWLPRASPSRPAAPTSSSRRSSARRRPTSSSA